MKKILPFALVLAFTLLAGPAGPALAQADDEKEVVVLGIGANEEAARKQAYRNAIQSIIGAMVISETMVENDELVRDKVLAHSDGYVTSARQIGPARPLEGGLVEVSMRVTVKSRQLRQTLQAENITVADMDGQSLFARKVTQDEQQQNAAAIINDKLKDLPASLLVAEADTGASEQKSSGGDAVQLSIPVKVLVNQQAYEIFAKDLGDTLAGLGFNFKNINVPLGISGGSMDLERRLLFKPFTDGVPNSDKQFLVGVCDLLNTAQKSSRWKNYLVTEDIYNCFSLKAAFSVRLTLLDASGGTVAEQAVDYSGNNRSNRDIASAAYRFPLSFIAPKGSSYVGAAQACVMPAATLSENCRLPLEGLSFKFTFDLTERELKSINSVRCTVVNIPLGK